MSRIKASWILVVIVCVMAPSAHAQVSEQWNTSIPVGYIGSPTAVTLGSDPPTVYLIGVIRPQDSPTSSSYLTTAAVDAFSGQRLWTATYPERPQGHANTVYALTLDLEGRLLYVTGKAERPGLPDVLVWILGINLTGTFGDASQNAIQGTMQIGYTHRPGDGPGTAGTAAQAWSSASRSRDPRVE